MELELSPILDKEALAKEFARKGRLQIKGVLAPKSAEGIYDALMRETPWGLVYNNGEEATRIAHEPYKNLGPDQMQALYRDIFIRAQSDFQYIYQNFPISPAGAPEEVGNPVLDRAYAFINVGAMMKLVRRVTEIPGLSKADAEATLYRQNTFMHWQGRKAAAHGARIGYSLNFTREWNPNWGGFLQLFDEHMNVEEAFYPAFNSLTLFSVPATYSVSFVALFCQGVRLSISGWYGE